MLVPEGLQWLLNVAFSEDMSVPNDFYIGLSADNAATIGAAGTLSDVTTNHEITGTGYSRQTVASNNTGFPTDASQADNDWHVVTKDVTFSCSAGDWDTAEAAFLATTNDGTGVLIAVADLSTSRSLLSGDSLVASFDIEAEG